MDARYGISRLSLLIFPVACIAGAGPTNAAPTGVLARLEQLKSIKAEDVPRLTQQIIGATNDPAVLIDGADILKNKFIDSQINQLQYWGEDSNAQTELGPPTTLALQLVARAGDLAQQRGRQIASQMRGPNDQSQIPRWQRMDALVRRAKFDELLLNFAKVLAMDPLDPDKHPLGQKTISDLQKFSGDASFGSIALLTQGKLFLSLNEPSQAMPIFSAIIASPHSDAGAIYQARYLSAICDLKAGNFEAAKTRAADLSGTSSGAAAAAAILCYRIDCAQADKSDTNSDKSKYNQLAIEEMKKLIKDHPSLKPMVLDHLANRFGHDSDVAHAGPLVLEAIMHRAALHQNDRQSLQNGAAAAAAVLNQRDRFDLDTLKYAAALSAMVNETDQNPIGAARAYLDLAELAKKDDLRTANAALDQALSICQSLRQNDPKDKSVTELYERALQAGISQPFNRTALLYPRGELFEQQGQYRAAFDAFQRIAKNDPHYLAARLHQMICLRGEMRTTGTHPGSSMNAGGSEIEALRKQIAAAADKSPESRQIAARATLVSADVLCNDLNQPQKALDQLHNFTSIVAGLKNGTQFLLESDTIRAQALMKLDQSLQAADILIAQANALSGANANLAYRLLNMIGEKLDRARADNDRQQTFLLASRRAELADYLAHWAAGNKDTNIRSQNYQYLRIKARSDLLAAESSPHATDFHPIKSEFQNLLTPESQAQYHQIDPATGDDPLACLGLAAAEFDLKNYATAREILIKLLDHRRLGSPRDSDAEPYWQATYTLLASNLALADQGKASADERKQTVDYLNRLFIEWGPATGGKYWRHAFDTLRQRVALADHKTN